MSRSGLRRDGRNAVLQRSGIQKAKVSYLGSYGTLALGISKRITALILLGRDVCFGICLKQWLIQCNIRKPQCITIVCVCVVARFQ